MAEAAIPTWPPEFTRTWSRRSARSRPPLALWLVAAGVAALVLLPVAYTVSEAVRVDPQQAADLLFRPLVAQLLLNTLSLIAVTTVAAAFIGTAAAWCVERTTLPGRRAWAVLAAVPLAVPAFVSSYAWVSISNAFQDFAGAVLVVTFAYYPLVYLPVAAALRGLDPALEDTARSLGLGPFACFRRVVLPQLRPALLGGMLLVALDTLTEFGAFALLRFRTFTTELYAQYRIGLDGPESSLLAIVLVLLCLVCLAAETWVRGRGRYARLGGGTRRVAAPHRLGWARWPIAAAFAILVIVTLGVPIGMIGFWLLQHAQAATSPAMPSAAALLSATLASIGFGIAGSAAAVVFALPLAYLATRYRGAWVTLIERIAYLAQGVPGIVIALALISLTVEALHPLYQSVFLLVITYAVLFLPLALVSVRAAIGQVQRRLEETGRSLGLGWFAVTRRILLPLAGPGVGAAAALVFVAIVTELTSTLLLAPIGTRTLATQVWANTSSLAFAAAAPFAALMLALSLASTWLLARRFGRAALPHLG